MIESILSNWTNSLNQIRIQYRLLWSQTQLLIHDNTCTSFKTLKHLHVHVQQQNNARNPDWEYEIATSKGFEKCDSCMVGQITENHQIVRDLQGPSHREEKGGKS